MGSKFIFKNILGTFVFDEQYKLLDKGMLGKSKHNLEEPRGEQLKAILKNFKDGKYFPEFHKKNLELAKKAVKDSLKDDILVIQAINNIEDTEKVINILAKDLREWYGYYNPEFSRNVSEHDKFIELILNKKDKKIKDSMGADFSKEKLEPIFNLTKKIQELYKFKAQQLKYLENLMKKSFPNLTEVAGAVIGAKLIEQAGSLDRLLRFPSSTIQLLGAEKALFRHMKTGSRAPKYGILLQHKLVQKAKEKGKAARALADKISIAVRVDYFKGKFVGDKLMKELENKIKW